MRPDLDNNTVSHSTEHLKAVSFTLKHICKLCLAVLTGFTFAREMSEMKRIKVRFAKDNETAFADFEVYNTPEANLGFLTFDTGMIR